VSSYSALSLIREQDDTKVKNILDHIFNLAGIVRGILLGICLGIAGLVIVGFFEVIVLGYDGISDSTLYAILIVTIIVAIILGFRGQA